MSMEDDCLSLANHLLDLCPNQQKLIHKLPVAFTSLPSISSSHLIRLFRALFNSHLIDPSIFEIGTESEQLDTIIHCLQEDFLHTKHRLLDSKTLQSGHVTSVLLYLGLLHDVINIMNSQSASSTDAETPPPNSSLRPKSTEESDNQSNLYQTSANQNRPNGLFSTNQAQPDAAGKSNARRINRLNQPKSVLYSPRTRYIRLKSINKNKSIFDRNRENQPTRKQPKSKSVAATSQNELRSLTNQLRLKQKIESKHFAGGQIECNSTSNWTEMQKLEAPKSAVVCDSPWQRRNQLIQLQRARLVLRNARVFNQQKQIKQKQIAESIKLKETSQIMKTHSLQQAGIFIPLFAWKQARVAQKLAEKQTVLKEKEAAQNIQYLQSIKNRPISLMQRLTRDKEFN